MPRRSSFNPHTHTGCDLVNNKFWSAKTVSIHTPIQGVTNIRLGLYGKRKFQSTHPYRVWLLNAVISASKEAFQSTHPYRVWPDLFLFRQIICGFNPHTHTGCDAAADQAAASAAVSIHTPIQGVTSLAFVSLSRFSCFNPHTHTGCDTLMES